MHEEFTRRAQQLDSMSKSSTKFASLIILVRKLAILLVIVLLAAAGLTYAGVDVPVVGPFLQDLMNR